MAEHFDKDHKDEFLLTVENGYIYFKIENAFDYPDKTCAWGGYDTQSTIEIKASNYFVKGVLYISTGDLYNFYIRLKECYEKLTGESTLESYEKNLTLKVIFDGSGHAKVEGSFKENFSINNELEFELSTDQTYLAPTIAGLEDIYNKYGDNKGVLMKKNN